MNRFFRAIILLSFSYTMSISISANDAHSGSMAAESSQQVLIDRAGAPLFGGMGSHTHSITGRDPGAQQYFDQGLVLAMAFNHAESIRSFQAAQRLDDDCAMCFWGEALASGPNINVTSNKKVIMAAGDRITAYAVLQKALARKAKVSEVERDYIDALAARYNGDPDTAREPLDLAYADAMRKLVNKYPGDWDAAALFSEALMNTMPWDYWSDKGQPKPATREVLDNLEKILAAAPNHPLAIHLYIHATEASSQPGKAEAAADRLTDLVPGAGHLVHMPAHTYWRIGRYNDASEANVRAAAVDEEYIAQCNAQGFYPAAYYPHNIHFLWAASSMEGRSQLSLDSARKVAANVHIEQIKQFPTVEFFKTIPLLALARFARWDEILQEPKPLEEFKYSLAIWHYARGLAMVATNRLSEASAELQAIVPLADTVSISFLDSHAFPASKLLNIAHELLQGELALSSGDTGTAIHHFRFAVAVQDELPYTEPPFWYYPTRQSLGYALMEHGSPGEAEKVYRKDLADYPRNGWSMMGLIKSLEAQDRMEEAATVRDQFAHVWSMADVKLTASRLLVPQKST